MGNEDYRRGRGYTMINKYMSSGGHLAGRRTISAEDMTNTYLVFTATLEFLKLGSDHSVFSGIIALGVPRVQLFAARSAVPGLDPLRGLLQ